MKCPFRPQTIHITEHEENGEKIYAKDIIEYSECYGEECPHYAYFNFNNTEVCLKTKFGGNERK